MLEGLMRVVNPKVNRTAYANIDTYETNYE
jgi:hypothetical protein